MQTKTKYAKMSLFCSIPGWIHRFSTFSGINRVDFVDQSDTMSQHASATPIAGPARSGAPAPPARQVVRPSHAAASDTATAHRIEAHAVNARDRVPGKSIIAGRSAIEESTDASRLTLTYHATDPTTGEALEQRYSCATSSQIEYACERAWEAWHAMRDIPAPEARAALLECIASKLALLADELPEIAAKETGFSVMHLRTERSKLLMHLHWLANEVRAGNWHKTVIESPDYDRRPIPKPDMRSMMRSIGPVMALGPGSLPIELGSAGRDTASAIAAGCPVVYKAHPYHPGTDEMMGWAVASAVEELDLHPGTFSMLHAGGRDRDVVAHTILQNPCIRGVVGSCSYEAADVLEAFAHKRNDGTRMLLTTGTANPVVVLPSALANETEKVARMVSEATVLFGGQSCHKPSIVLGIASEGFESLTHQMVDRLSDAEQHIVISEYVRERYNAQLRALGGISHVEFRSGKVSDHASGHSSQGTAPISDKTAQQSTPVAVSPAILRTDAKTFQKNALMYRELFGPAIILVSAANEAELIQSLASFQGFLNATLWAQPADGVLAKKIMPVLEQRCGRIVLNDSAIHIEDCAALVIGGPSPAQMESHHAWSSTGRDSIARFTRPVCFEHVWESLLPPELHQDNPLDVAQTVDGQLNESEPLPEMKAKSA